MGLRAMTARYNGTCGACGEDIRAGEQIAYDGDHRVAYHAACEAVALAPAPYWLTVNAERGAPAIGQVIATPRGRDGQPYPAHRDYPAHLVVVRRRYVPANEDNDDFEDRWSVDCRQATAEEAAPLIEAARRAAIRRDAAQQLKVIERQVILMAREQGTLTNDADMPPALVGDTFGTPGRDQWLTVAGDRLESRSRWRIDATDHSAIAVDAELAAEARDLIAAYDAASEGA